jgi:putative DNA-invertase from lambdoid prophage Rac
MRRRSNSPISGGRVRAAIYARVSTLDQSCGIQLDELRGWAARHQMTLHKEYVDQGISGGKGSRPALDELLKDAQARRFDLVLVLKLDRFGRSVAHLTKQLLDLERWGVRFVATSQGIDTDRSNPTSKLLLHMLAAVAEFERELIRERTRAGVRAAKARGKVLGRPRRVFRRDEVVRLRSQGMSWRAIAQELGAPVSTLRDACAEIVARKELATAVETGQDSVAA